MKNITEDAPELIACNQAIHDAVADTYDRRHVEIYNSTEQARLRASLEEAIAQIQTGSQSPYALDYGAGTGNLSMHLMACGARVAAADVSERSLSRLQEKVKDCRSSLETHILNGSDLTAFETGSFDVVATYSVLHHVPDYLRIVEEFVRVVKPGGVIYIDHEACPAYWSGQGEYFEYLQDLGTPFLEGYCTLLGRPVPRTWAQRMRRRIRNVFSPAAWQAKFGRPRTELASAQQHRISPEGDIHTYIDDHIEWPKIEAILGTRCEIRAVDDYLVCRELSKRPAALSKWNGRCSDMRRLIARKRL